MPALSLAAASVVPTVPAALPRPRPRRPAPSPARAPRVALAPRPVRVGLLGLGTVGQGLVTLLARRADDLAARHRVAFRVEGVLVRDPSRARRIVPDAAPLTADPAAFEAGDYDVVVEAIGGLEPAGALVERFLRRGVPVVTANKALLADRGPHLAEVAAAHGAALRFEASVAAGLPVFALLEHALQTTTVARVEAILNATSNVVVTRLDGDGASVGAALEQARRWGYAEADARLDTSGFDAAQKLSVLAWTLSGRSLPWHRLEIRGIDDLTPDDAARARALGGRLKPLACADLGGDRARGWVGPAFVPDTHPLAGVRDAGNGVRFVGDTIDDLFVAGPGAGGVPTAAAILDDLVALVAAGDPRPAPRLVAPRAVGPERPVESPHFVAVPLGAAEDAARAADRVRTAFAAASLALTEAVVRAETRGPVLVGLTPSAPPRAVRAAATRCARAGLEVRAFRALPRR